MTQPPRNHTTSPMAAAGSASESSGIPTLRFDDDGLRLLDQTRLPDVETELVCQTVDQVHDAIRRLVVRGAPAIGIAAAYGVCLARGSAGPLGRSEFHQAADHLATSRPTAVNLFWALDRMRKAAERLDDDCLYEGLVAEARQIEDEDRRMCRQIGHHGAELLRETSAVLTHCNAGSLAASTWGTALAPIYCLNEQGLAPKVFADETRPLLQGARLTAWELDRAGIDVTVICDNMAGWMMRQGKIDAVIVGADRIAANGDVANKIGTYAVAVLARAHELPFYVAAPSSTFDLTLDDGDAIPIEQRGRDEVARPESRAWVPPGIPVENPAFDVTPASLVSAIITERAVIPHPNADLISKTLGN